MKCLILLILFIAPAAVFGQFKLTPSGFDTTKNYYVIEMPGVNQADLYKKTLVYLNGIYVSPKEVLSLVENESITINAVAIKAIKMKVLYLKS